MPIRTLAIALLLFAAARAHAEVREAAPDSFFIAFTESVSATPAKAYADITHVERWWDDQHTWSGKAANLKLVPAAGGCFCERWKGGSAEHGRIIMALPGHLLRLQAALGPLQEFALKGTLSFWIRTENDATTLALEYRVNGGSTSRLDTFAPEVDKVLGAQFARLKRYIETGNPAEPPPPPPSPAKAAAAAADAQSARDEILEEWKKSAEEATRGAESKDKAAKPADTGKNPGKDGE